MKTLQEAAREYMPDSFEPDEFYPIRAGYLVDVARRSFLTGAAFATRWISIEDELPDDDTLILTKDSDGRIDLIRGWQLKERIKPYAVQNFCTHWRSIEPVKK